MNAEATTVSSLGTKLENAVATSSDSDTQTGSKDGRQMMNGSLGSVLSLDTNRKRCALGHFANDNLEIDIAEGETIKIASITAKWSEDLPKNTLTDVSVDVRLGELVAVVGPVGSGKVSCCCVVGDCGGM
jgi:ABC-type multidrug transport system fused ATPase/permease subunit